MTDLDSAIRSAARFGLTPVSACFVPHGHIHRTFFVDCTEGPYVFQRLNTSVFADIGALTANLVAVCSHVGAGLVPEPVRAEDGAWTLREGDEVWRAFERVRDACQVAIPSQGTAHQAGVLLGRFHARLHDLDPAELVETIPGFHDLQRRTDALREVVNADPFGRAQLVGREIDTLFEAGPVLAQLAGEIVRSTPVRASHNDAKLDNFLFRGTTAVCVVDLDTTMAGRRFWDVGDLLRTAATTAREDDPGTETAVVPELYEAVMDGYLRGVSGVPSTSEELDALEAAGALVTYEQSVRFLTDWIAGDVYYSTTRPGQNLDRARSQLRLLGSMPGGW
jgi:Ser/Thr protein kinase RdoA (MazF antagonist)